MLWTFSLRDVSWLQGSLCFCGFSTFLVPSYSLLTFQKRARVMARIHHCGRFQPTAALGCGPHRLPCRYSTGHSGIPLSHNSALRFPFHSLVLLIFHYFGCQDGVFQSSRSTVSLTQHCAYTTSCTCMGVFYQLHRLVPVPVVSKTTAEHPSLLTTRATANPLVFHDFPLFWVTLGLLGTG